MIIWKANKFSLELRYPISLKPTASVFALSFLEAGNGFDERRAGDFWLEGLPIVPVVTKMEGSCTILGVSSSISELKQKKETR